MDTSSNTPGMPLSPPKPPMGEPKPLKGVGGWLMFFVVTSVLGLCHEVWEMKKLIDSGWESYMATGMTTFLFFSGCVLCFYAYALYSLIAVKRYAVRLIKLALIIVQLTALLTPILIFAVVRITSGVNLFTEDTLVATYKNVGAELIGPIVRSVIWYAYFCVSVRVKNTWPDPKLARPESVFA